MDSASINLENAVIVFETTSVNDIDDKDDLELQNILKEFQLESLFVPLKSHGIDYEALKYLSKEDISEAIENIGLRAKFREKLFAWRKIAFGIEDETLSVNSKVCTWLQKSASNTPTTQSTISNNHSPLTVKYLNIFNILKKSLLGNSILVFYERNSKLLNSHREDLMKLILEEANCNNITIKYSDFPRIVDQIVSIFPTEFEVKEFYFIPRAERNKNPGGKLYNKYTNSRNKRQKLSQSFEKDQINISIELEFDETIGTALKTELSRDCSDWEVVCNKWKQTCSIRQRDLKSLQPIEFLESWPRYTDARASDLIKIDFTFLFEGKDHLLFAKWDHFKKVIQNYYSENIHNDCCKSLLSQVQLAQTLGNLKNGPY